MTKQKNCMSLKSYQSSEKKTASKIKMEDGANYNVEIVEQCKISNKLSQRTIHISETYTITKINESDEDEEYLEDILEEENDEEECGASEDEDDFTMEDTKSQHGRQVLQSQLITTVENQSQIESVSFSDQD